MIYIIGDSHVSVFSGTDKQKDGQRHIQPEFGTCYTLREGKLREKINDFEQRIPFFCPIKIGSHTAYNSFNKVSKIEQVISEYQITDKDFIVFCFGEIDIRNHIGFQSEKQNLPISEIIEVCVENYMKTILYFKNKKFNISVYAPPSSSKGYSINSHLEYGDVILRNQMTLSFTHFLKKKCKENEITLYSIAEKMMLPDGTTNNKFIMDDIHLSQEAIPLILKEFKNLIHLDLQNNNITFP